MAFKMLNLEPVTFENLTFENLSFEKKKETKRIWTILFFFKVLYFITLKVKTNKHKKTSYLVIIDTNEIFATFFSHYHSFFSYKTHN